jgi:hypothetical protein
LMRLVSMLMRFSQALMNIVLSPVRFTGG